MEGLDLGVELDPSLVDEMMNEMDGFVPMPVPMGHPHTFPLLS
jgi:hypothetical protein